MKHLTNPNTKISSAGFSLVEAIITIAIIGILASLAVASLGNINKSSRIAVARNVVEKLNNATKQFGHAQYNIIAPFENSSSDDEEHLLQTLQWIDDTIEIGVAGPFMRTDWVPSVSDSEEDYRAVWTGSYWRLAQPEEAGAGLLIDFHGTDLGNTDPLPPTFTPINSRGTNIRGYP